MPPAGSVSDHIPRRDNILSLGLWFITHCLNDLLDRQSPLSLTFTPSHAILILSISRHLASVMTLTLMSSLQLAHLAEGSYTQRRGCAGEWTVDRDFPGGGK